MTAAALGNLVTVYAVTVGLFALVAGPISDRVGRRRVLLWGSALMTVALALHGAASSYSSLLALRTLAGVAGGILSGAVVAFVGDYFPSDRRGWANGWVMTGFATGQILGVPLGTLLWPEELSGGSSRIRNKKICTAKRNAHATSYRSSQGSADPLRRAATWRGRFRPARPRSNDCTRRQENTMKAASVGQPLAALPTLGTFLESAATRLSPRLPAAKTLGVVSDGVPGGPRRLRVARACYSSGHGNTVS